MEGGEGFPVWVDKAGMVGGSPGVWARPCHRVEPCEALVL